MKEAKNKKENLIAELTTAIEAVLKQNGSDSSGKIGKTIKSASAEVAKKFLKKVKESDKKALKTEKKTAPVSKKKTEAKPRTKKEVVVEQ